MTVKTNFLLALGVTALVLIACKNDKPAGQEAADIPLVPSPDTVIGIDGADNCGFSPISKDSIDYFYQKYQVRLVRNPDGKSSVMTITGAPDQPVFKLAVQDNQTFMGLSRNYLYLEEGTAPDIRQITIYDIPTQKPLFRDTYCDELLIASNGKLWFWSPIDQSAVDSLPACPDSAQWVKEGLQCGYAQRKLYDPISNALAAKSEYKCFARQ